MRLSRIAAAAGIDLVDALLGRSCPGCAGPTPRRRAVCDACDALVPRSGSVHCILCLRETAARPDAPADPQAPAGAERICPRHGAARILLAGPRYAPPLDRVIHAFKYAGVRELGGWVASLLPEPPARDEPIWREYALVPVPLHPARRAWRGFDQARLLAQLAGRAWGIPVLDALTRTRDHPPQARLPRPERPANVRDAFRVLPALTPAVRDRPILLVDDVATTGSTLLEAAEALEALNPAWIVALSASHGGPDSSAEPSLQAEVAAGRAV
ncbi:MAG TPA: phosphoribosyltransferase family protein [Candidatus Eisenbacteria bacterium]|nr:phosphoribosyltransferase family protein [Candidatus Eisenbacteria bacterium]